MFYKNTHTTDAKTITLLFFDEVSRNCAPTCEILRKKLCKQKFSIFFFGKP